MSLQNLALYAGIALVVLYGLSSLCDKNMLSEGFHYGYGRRWYNRRLFPYNWYGYPYWGGAYPWWY